jgi:hypothetical protein
MKIETERLILRQFTDNGAFEACYNSKRPIVAHFVPDYEGDYNCITK